MTDQHAAVRTSSLRHPAEVPFFVVMVVLNVAIVLVIVRAAIVVPFLPESLQTSPEANAIRAALIGLLLFVPALVVIREVQRATTRGTAVQLSERQFPELYRTADELAAALRLSRRPDIFVANGNGELNAFAAQAAGHDYVVLNSELFANLYAHNRDGLRFVLGHELGHIRLHHVSLWYQIAVAYSSRIPILGATLSRLREYSCDRHGAVAAPSGAAGLVLLTSGRHTQTDVDVGGLVEQGRHLRGFWVGLAQLPRSHPFTVRRLDRLVGLGLLHPPAPMVAVPSDEQPAS
ncbi:Zn-dependent protease with chaperone function [Actinomycetospora succinea]|uniref:Zn-dependent protease with chaperone function n=1 Tax=Actinomycetospora succinea TaxID=663603 RepID=A0A4R6VHI3_9PSEU|nr:M48 family metallopeptidase [Actinomycetospora succinea]TDQ60930.1 Zn-dependent protease with chaperone function [Actinomycetospora succinea]